MKSLITLLAVLCAGCATGTPSMHSMNNYDLNYFQYDCARSREQIAFLNSLRRTPDDQLFSISGWAGVDRHIKSKSKNVLIATHGDVVKSLVLHALGSHLNNIDKLEIDNVSISVLERDGNSLRVLTVNDLNSKASEFMK